MLEIIVLWIFGTVWLTIASLNFSQSKSWWAGGVLGACIGTVVGLVTMTWYYFAVSFVLLVILGLVLDYIFSKLYASGKLKIRISQGSERGSFSTGSRSSSSGFGHSRSFGGGSSGGGGASGKW